MTTTKEIGMSQATRTYDVHPNALNRLILMGRLKARKDANGRWLIDVQSLEQWNQQRVRRSRRQPA